MYRTVPRANFRKGHRTGRPGEDRDAGTTSPEYGLVLVAVAAALLTAFLTLGQSLADEFRCFTEQLSGSAGYVGDGAVSCGALPQDPGEPVPSDDVPDTAGTSAPGPATEPTRFAPAAPVTPPAGTDSPTGSPTTGSPTKRSPTTSPGE